MAMRWTVGQSNVITRRVIRPALAVARIVPVAPVACHRYGATGTMRATARAGLITRLVITFD